MPITLNPNREKSLLRRHPWIFAGAIHSVDETHAPGEPFYLISSEGHFSCAGILLTRIPQIRARVWTFIDEFVDKEFFRKPIKTAIEMRQRLKVESHSNA